MKFRWFIRSFAITLLTLCLGVWAWSYFQYFAIDYGSNNQSYGVETYMGGVGFRSYFQSIPPMDPPSWRFAYGRDACSLSDFSAAKRFMGFTYFETPDDDMVGGPMYSGVGIPFWFLSLLSAGLLWLVWRQTRPKTG